MPKTLRYRPLLIDELISNDRIGSYTTVFHPANDVELMGVYLWNGHVSGAIYPIICTAEIALRNAIDQALTPALGRFWWSSPTLRFRSFTAGMHPNNYPAAVKKVRKNFSNAADKYIQEKRKRYHLTGHIAPDHSGVIAKTEFSTWQFLLDNEFMGNTLIWPRYLGRVFAGPWPNTSAATTLRHAHDLVLTVREFRNRLFHFEPAWKRYGVLTATDAIAHLHEKIDKIEELLRLIQPENILLLQKNGLLGCARRACSITEIRRFQHLADVQKIRSISKLAAAIDNCRTTNSVLNIQVYRGQYQKFLMTPM